MKRSASRWRKLRTPFMALSLAIALGGLSSVVAISMLIAPAQKSIPDDALGLPHENVEFDSASGSRIRGWYVPGLPGMGTVVLMHGIRANRLAMAGRARFLHEAGYAALLFDFQAHGESPGAHISFGHLEALDARAAVDYARQRRPGFVGAIGVSLGGAAALLGPEPLPVQALVLEAVYPDIDTATRNRIRMRLGHLDALLARLFLLQLKPRLGIAVEELSPRTAIARVTAPLLIIGGDEDLHTTPQDTQQLYNAAPPDKSLWMVPGAKHVNLDAYAGAEYRARILAFLARCREAQAAR